MEADPLLVMEYILYFASSIKTFLLKWLWMVNYQIIPGAALILLTSIKSLRIDKTTDYKIVIIFFITA